MGGLQICLVVGSVSPACWLAGYLFRCLLLYVCSLRAANQRSCFAFVRFWVLIAFGEVAAGVDASQTVGLFFRPPG